MHSHIRKVYACLTVTCHLHLAEWPGSFTCYCGNTGVAGPKQHESASPGLGTCYPHGGRYDCHGYHGFRQPSGTDCVYATDSMPSCDICLCASVGTPYSLPSTSSTPLTSTLHHSGQAVFSSCLSRSPYAYPPPSYTGMYGAIPHSEHRFPAPASWRKYVVNHCLEFGAIPYLRASDYPLTHPSSSRGAGLASEGSTANPT